MYVFFSILYKLVKITTIIFNTSILIKLLLFNFLKIGTLAGNLMMKRQHYEFPSDIYVMLEAVGATLNIRTYT